MKQPLDMPYYLELQRRMFDAFRYVSCHERNFSAYSIILESLLIDACSFFDSLCQTLIREKSLTGHVFGQQNQIAKFNEKLNNNEEFNFGDYRILLEGDFALSGMEVNLNPYDDAFYSNPSDYTPDAIDGYLLAPFKEWSVSGSHSPWWRAFTELKHDRLSNFPKATLGNVILSLAATFIVLTLRNEADFKAGRVSPELYALFLPKYWQWNGRVFSGIFQWK